VEFYREFHEGRSSEDEDWMPMVRAVQALQTLPAAPALYAFTSLARFHVTTAPKYAECDKHSSASIIWKFPNRLFELAFAPLANGWADDRSAEVICQESNFFNAVGPFVDRVLASRPPTAE
jgi:hypothetical protein